MRLVVIAALAAGLCTASPAGAFTPAAGAVRIEFDAAFGLKLVTKGVNAAPIAPAKQDSLAFRLPVRPGGTVSADGSKARIRTRGGVDMDDPADGVRITLTRLVAGIDGRRLDLTGFALLDGIGYDRFAFADGRVGKARVTKQGLRVRDVTLRLNGIAVAALNSQLATTEFEEGERIGTARLDVSA